MAAHAFVLSRSPRRALLTTCLTTALGLTLSPAFAIDSAHSPPVRWDIASVSELPVYLRYLDALATRVRTTFEQLATPTTPTMRMVSSCVDDPNLPGSLRYEVDNAANGDFIDLTTLACSTITLGSEIVVTQDSLYLQGPGAGDMTIDAASQSRLFRHAGHGTFGLDGLTISDGYSRSYGAAYGGCIYSNGDILLTRSVVSHCAAVGIGSGDARGGGIYSQGTVTMSQGEVSYSYALSKTGLLALGGGVYARHSLHIDHSSITKDGAYSVGGTSAGGGVRTYGEVTIQNSTISRNGAQFAGGLELLGSSQTVSIINSTISKNVAFGKWGGVFTTLPITLFNSTVAFNANDSDIEAAGIFTNHAALIAQSSIIADNRGSSGASDVGGQPGDIVTGANNLIISSLLPVPADTIQDCPHLDPLAENGGPTLTHKLAHTSLAIDNGNNTISPPLTQDQRGAVRVVNSIADIGAVEWQPGENDESIFVNGLDGLCDQ